ncbi:MAG TPA: VirB8/TrbF family protein, partial [Sphingomicrobium sp.]|nr:VirB8/TrbF family protein [Sphingomicrobium sp.]
MGKDRPLTAGWSDPACLKWIETNYEQGSPLGTSRWTAILAVDMRPPANADTLRKNPLGLYVEA